MRVFCLGLSHRTAPVEIRERFSLTSDATPGMLGRMREAGLVAEVSVENYRHRNSIERQVQCLRIT